MSICVDPLTRGSSRVKLATEGEIVADLIRIVAKVREFVAHFCLERKLFQSETVEEFCPENVEKSSLLIE